MLFEICWIYSVHLKRLTRQIFPHSTRGNGISDEINFLAHSINLQGNDKVMWMLLRYFEEREKRGEALPEVTLIDDEDLRSEFIHHITA